MTVRVMNVGYLQGYTSTPIQYGREDASQTFVKGNVVLLDTSSWELAICTDEAVIDIMGIAAQNASTTTGTSIAFVPAMPGVVFEASVGSSTTAGPSATAMIGEEAPVQVSSLDMFLNPITDNTNSATRILALKDDTATVNGRVYFMFLAGSVWYHATT